MSANNPELAPRKLTRHKLAALRDERVGKGGGGRTMSAQQEVESTDRRGHGMLVLYNSVLHGSCRGNPSPACHGCQALPRPRAGEPVHSSHA